MEGDVEMGIGDVYNYSRSARSPGTTAMYGGPQFASVYGASLYPVSFLMMSSIRSSRGKQLQSPSSDPTYPMRLYRYSMGLVVLKYSTIRTGLQVDMGRIRPFILFLRISNSFN
ncbi:hypothetical protein L6452_44107 [Arctium lappa]|uniref:Uncharacterized protein n=1 Tax=Arctium lappa TaxID=4217 RepID=A0ACB8XER3_ARCLA|nr:hypothetical protein L6452_44107 [Arctium lappa]